MNKKLLFTLYLVFVLCGTSVSQEICGTPVNLNQKLQSFSTTASLAEDTSICLNIFFHVIRNDNGTGGINSNDLDAIVDNLNSSYNSQGIFFVNAGFDLINDTNFMNIDDQNEAENLSQINNNSNAINYYVVETLWNTPTGFITGTAIEIPSNNLVIRRDRVLTSTSSHEVGHCLNLLHTFQGTAAGTAGCAENINGSNCSTCGDEICDTPADANIGNANGFSPDLTNIMSYYNMRNHFTDGQGLRMKNSVMNNNMLSQIMSNSCSIPELTGTNIICSGSNYTYTLQNPPSTFNWSISSNLEIISSNSNSITVKSKYSSSTGAGFISANYNNGAEEIFEVYVNKPDIDITLDSSAPDTEAYAIVTGESTLIENQHINQYPYYTVVSSSGYSNVYIYEGLDDGYIVKGIGSTNTWSKTIDFYISNNCGTTVERITLTPPPPSGGCNYTLQSTDVNTYSLLPPPDCLSSFQTMASNESSVMMNSKVAPPDIFSIKVYNMNGALLLETDEQFIRLESLKKGFYIIKATWNGNETTKKVAKS